MRFFHIVIEKKNITQTVISHFSLKENLMFPRIALKMHYILRLKAKIFLSLQIQSAVSGYIHVRWELSLCLSCHHYQVYKEICSHHVFTIFKLLGIVERHASRLEYEGRDRAPRGRFPHGGWWQHLLLSEMVCCGIVNNLRGIVVIDSRVTLTHQFMIYVPHKLITK